MPDFDLSTAVAIARSDELVAYKLADARVVLVAGTVAIEVTRHDRVWVELGGMGAATGIVPYAVWLADPVRKRALVDESIDEQMTDGSARARSEAAESVLAAVAAASGAAHVTLRYAMTWRSLVVERTAQPSHWTEIETLEPVPHPLPCVLEERFQRCALVTLSSKTREETIDELRDRAGELAALPDGVVHARTSAAVLVALQVFAHDALALSCRVDKRTRGAQRFEEAVPHIVPGLGARTSVSVLRGKEGDFCAAFRSTLLLGPIHPAVGLVTLESRWGPPS